MLKKIIVCLAFCLSSSLYSYPQHSPRLNSPMQMLYQLKEVRELIEKIETDGEIFIKEAPSGMFQSNAAWLPDERTIYINFGNRRTESSLIISLLFEMHNALHQEHFDKLDAMAMQKTITKHAYVEAVERIEYEGAMKMTKLLKKGVDQRIFPHDTVWDIAPNFDEHFRVQMEAGHSQCIADVYDFLTDGSYKNDSLLYDQREPFPAKRDQLIPC